VARLAYGPATAGQLAELAAMSRPAVSQHVRVLREAASPALISAKERV
jgi:DNA-binding transcriptional ArsR family regulator